MNILLVEDHDDTRSIVARLLRRDGFDVEEAATVAEALASLAVFRFDVLLSDIALPDGSGLDVVAEAKRRQPWEKAIALSAYSSEADRERGRKAGFDHYLGKPFDFGSLRRLLRPAPAIA